MELGPVWCGTEAATACLSSGARFGRHNSSGKSVARCGVGGGQPNRPLNLICHMHRIVVLLLILIYYYFRLVYTSFCNY
jgi:hypothetical protein